MLSLFRHGTIYFRRWHSLRWFLLLMMPIVASAGAVLIRRQGVMPAGVVFATGTAVAVAIFMILATGEASTNTGTYFRHTEPRRYWLLVGVLFVSYFFVSVGGYFVKGKTIDHPQKVNGAQEP